MPQNKKTILILLDLNPKKTGSLERMLIALSRRLSEKNFHPVLVFRGEIPTELRGQYQGITIDTLPKSGHRLRLYSKLIKIMKKYKPDIIHVNFHAIFSFLIFPIYLCGCRHIVFTDHIAGEIHAGDSIKNRLVYLRNQFMLPLIGKILCVSNYVLERNKTIPAMDPAKLQRIYLGVDLKTFHPVSDNSTIREELGIAADTFVVSTVANLIDGKGVSFLIRAAKKIIEQFDNTVFLIAGDGDDASKFKQLTQELGLENKVIFLGLRNDTHTVYAASDVFVCASVLPETFGLTKVEAMACGIPVIATRVGGVPEIVEDNITGILIEPGDEQAITLAIEKLYQDPGLRKQMGEKSVERVLAHFDLERTVNETVAVYENMVT